MPVKRGTARKPAEERVASSTKVVAHVRRGGSGIYRDIQGFSHLLTSAAPRAFKAAVAILGDSQEAEDAVQEAAIVAFRCVDQLRDVQAFTSWFLRIAVNKAIDLHRRRKREWVRIEAFSTSLVSQWGVAPDGLETAMDVVEAVEQLPTAHRVVVRLHYAAGYTTSEIARILDKPVGTIRRHLSEAYKMLRPLLTPVLSEGGADD